MEQDILNIINDKEKIINTEIDDKDLAKFLNDLEKLDEERFKFNKYKNEVATLLTNE